jgi:hypothetical protein
MTAVSDVETRAGIDNGTLTLVGVVAAVIVERAYALCIISLARLLVQVKI